MAIELVSVDQIRSGRGGKSKGEKYGKYAIAIQKNIPWIKEQIKKSKDGFIRVKNEDIRKEMGGEFVKKNETSVYWGLKYVLFQEGVVVESGTKDTGEKLLIMRLADNEDRLPDSLAKYLEPAEVDEDTTVEDEDEDKDLSEE